MSIEKKSLSESDIDLLKMISNGRKKMYFYFLFFLLFTVLVYIFIYGLNDFFTLVTNLKYFLILFFLGLILMSLFDFNLENDIYEKKKWVGLIWVKQKESIYDPEYNKTHFKIIFDDWRIGEVFVKEEFWNQLLVGDIFYVEKAVNSNVFIVFRKDDFDFKNELI